MVWAWKKIRNQLGRSPGMLAYTTGVAGATEFFTLTFWEKEIDMTMFMSSEDHRDMMWNFRTWTESFWSMRWNPVARHNVLWNGMEIDVGDREQEAKSAYVGPGYLREENISEKLRPYLNNIVRKTDPETIEVRAIIARLPTVNPIVIRRLKLFTNDLNTDNQLLRNKIAIGWGDCLIFLTWQIGSNVDSDQISRELNNSFPGIWQMTFTATDFEVGHWNMDRFRELEAPGNSHSNLTLT